MVTRRTAMLAGMTALGVGAGGLTAGGTSDAAGPRGRGYRVSLDDFRSGFTSGPDGAWWVSPAGPLPEGDGVATASDGRLRVVPTATHPTTGEPAFAYTTGQEEVGGTGLSDHLKWFALANHQATSGVLGFDALPGQVLTYEGTVAASAYGTADHPFGSAVPDAQSDIRLAAAAFNTVDMQSFLVFDFFLTNTCLYAFYERLPRPGAHYAAFSYALPVARRTPGGAHRLSISLDRSAGVVTWSVDGRQVLRVDRLGYLPADRRNLIIDLGGTEELVSVPQLACGIGLFTLLDAKQPNTQTPALVRLSSETSYYDPAYGAPDPQRFVDEQSLQPSRLWGQGAELTASRLVVHSRPGRL